MLISNYLDLKHTEFLDFINFQSFELCNDVLNINRRTLDLVLVNKENKGNCGVSKADEALLKEDQHHPALTIDINITGLSSKKLEFGTSYYDFKNCDFLKLSLLMRDADWSPLYRADNVNEALELFYCIFYSFLDETVPTKSVKLRKFPIWFNVDIKRHLIIKINIKNLGTYRIFIIICI